jgi:hypothetical protein
MKTLRLVILAMVLGLGSFLLSACNGGYTTTYVTYGHDYYLAPYGYYPLYPRPYYYGSRPRPWHHRHYMGRPHYRHHHRR